MEIKRESIIKAIARGLKDDPSVFALWLEGSDATGTTDRYSDLDIWLDVKDGTEASTLDKVGKLLSGLGALDFAYQMEHPHPQIRQMVFHLQDTPASLLLDVCVQSHGRNFAFVKGLDDSPKVIFDKGAIKFKAFNQKEFQQELITRLDHVKNTFAQKIRVITKVERGEFLEALMYYHRWIIEPLVELLRIKYAPRKRDYHFKHIARDLPKAVVDQVEQLCKIQSIADIRRGVEASEKLFQKTLAELS